MDVFAKIAKLKEKYPDEESTLQILEWEKNVKKASLLNNLKNNDGFKLLIEKYLKDIDSIDKELMTNEKLFSTSEGRELGTLLHARKKWCKDFLRIFEVADAKVKNFTNLVDERLLDE